MKRWMRAIFAGALLLTPAAGLAAIDGSHHDMTSFLLVTEKCAYCHAVSLAGTATGFGQTGAFCIIVCHDGANITSAITSTPGTMGTTVATRFNWIDNGSSTDAVNFTMAHSSTVANLDVIGDQSTDVAATGWPHTDASVTRLECTSCHTVHDDNRPPFLNSYLATGQVTGANQAYCIRCHQGDGAAFTGTAGRYCDITTVGAHPVEFTYANTPGRGPAAMAATKLARRMEIKSTALNVGTTGNYASLAAFRAARNANAWITGGHFIDTSTALPTTNEVGAMFGCYTCHSVHQNNATNTSGSGKLVMGQIRTTLGGTTYTSNFCVGCHGDRTGAAPINSVNNPGNTNFWHPTNEETAMTGGTWNSAVAYTHEHTVHTATTGLVPNTGTFPIVVNLSELGGGGANVYVGANAVGQGQILCVSCHEVHGGVSGTMAIRVTRSTAPATSATSSVCLGCHRDSTGAQTGNNQHHPGGTINFTTTGFPGTTGWQTVDGLGSLTDGVSCPDCHVFQARPAGASAHRATAHNW